MVNFFFILSQKKNIYYTNAFLGVNGKLEEFDLLTISLGATRRRPSLKVKLQYVEEAVKVELLLIISNFYEAFVVRCEIKDSTSWTSPRRRRHFLEVLHFYELLLKSHHSSCCRGEEQWRIFLSLEISDFSPKRLFLSKECRSKKLDDDVAFLSFSNTVVKCSNCRPSTKKTKQHLIFRHICTRDLSIGCPRKTVWSVNC